MTTFDNSQFSKLPALDSRAMAESPTKLWHDGLDQVVRMYVEASVSDNSRRAYAADLTDFAVWGG